MVKANAKVSCSEVQCEGASDAGSAKVILSEVQREGPLQTCGEGNAEVNYRGEGKAKVSCSEVQCEGACDAGSGKVNYVRSSAKALDKLVVKAIRG